MEPSSCSLELIRLQTWDEPSNPQPLTLHHVGPIITDKSAVKFKFDNFSNRLKNVYGMKIVVDTRVEFYININSNFNFENIFNSKILKKKNRTSIQILRFELMHGIYSKRFFNFSECFYGSKLGP